MKFFLSLIKTAIYPPPEPPKRPMGSVAMSLIFKEPGGGERRKRDNQECHLKKKGLHC